MLWNAHQHLRCAIAAGEIAWQNQILPSGNRISILKVRVLHTNTLPNQILPLLQQNEKVLGKKLDPGSHEDGYFLVSPTTRTHEIQIIYFGSHRARMFLTYYG